MKFLSDIFRKTTITEMQDRIDRNGRQNSITTVCSLGTHLPGPLPRYIVINAANVSQEQPTLLHNGGDFIVWSHMPRREHKPLL